MGAYAHTTLVPASALQPGDVLLGPWQLTRALWVSAHRGGETGPVTIWWPDTTSCAVPPEMPVLILTRPRPPHDMTDPERIERVRSAALGATWLRHLQHPGAPHDTAYAMLCDAYDKVVHATTDPAAHMLTQLLAGRSQDLVRAAAQRAPVPAEYLWN